MAASPVKALGSPVGRKSTSNSPFNRSPVKSALIGAARRRVGLFSPPRRVSLTAAALAWVVLLSFLGRSVREAVSPVLMPDHEDDPMADLPSHLGSRVLLEGLGPPIYPPLFTCPDGRNGIQVIHTRFLLGQYNANITFMASRLLLMSTFFVPTLNAQTSQNFVVVASYDARLPPTVIKAMKAELDKLRAPVLLQEEAVLGRSLHEAYLARAAMVPLLRQKGIIPADAPDKLDLYITSRMDTDDAVHVRGVAEVQRLACSGPETKNYALQVVYMKAGLLWEPSGEQQAPHGMVAPPIPEPRFLAILQSMITGYKMEKCKMNVYSHRHTQPFTLNSVTKPDCPFVLRIARNIHVWEPPAGEWGSLYTRTRTSSTIKKNKTEDDAWAPAMASALRRSFGLDPANVVLTNLFFAGFGEEAPELLVAKNPWGGWR